MLCYLGDCPLWPEDLPWDFRLVPVQGIATHVEDPGRGCSRACGAQTTEIEITTNTAIGNSVNAAVSKNEVLKYSN